MSGKNLNKLNIIVAGWVGVGKSTLINGVFGKEVAKTGVGEPVTRDCTKYTLNDCSITIYDTKGFETGENNHEEQIFKKIKELNSCSNRDDYIHFCWYCVSDMGNKIEPNEIKFIKDVNQRMKVPVIIVITQSFGRNNSNTKKLIEAIEKELSGIIIDIVPVMALECQFSHEYGEIIVKQHGLEELVNKTIKFYQIHQD